MVLEKRFERSEAEHLIENFIYDPIFFDETERSLLLFDQSGHGHPDFHPHALACHGGKSFEINSVEQLAMESEL
jgi:hypothetical protein